MVFIWSYRSFGKRIDGDMFGLPVNDESHVPFGGIKNSGLGRHGGQAAVDTFTELRWHTLERGGRHNPAAISGGVASVGRKNCQLRGGLKSDVLMDSKFMQPLGPLVLQPEAALEQNKIRDKGNPNLIHQ